MTELYSFQARRNTSHTNTPWQATDGVVVTTGDVGNRIRVPTGPRAGTSAWVARSMGPGQWRTSEWVTWNDTNFTQYVAPQVGDAYEILVPNGHLHVGRINVLPTSASPFNQSTGLYPTAVTFHEMDIHPANDNMVMPIINGGVQLIFDNCAFTDGEWIVFTMAQYGDFGAATTYFENCGIQPSGAAQSLLCRRDFHATSSRRGSPSEASWRRREQESHRL